MYSYIPLGLNQLLNVGVDQWLLMCIMDTCLWVCLGQGSLLLLGPLFHFPQCHNDLVSSRNEHVCPCHSMTKAGSWFGGQKGSRCLHFQLPTNSTLSQSRLLHRDGLDPCVGNSSAPEWLLKPRLQRWCCCLAVFWTVGGRLSQHCGNGSWWSLLPALSRSFWSHQCKLHQVILVTHDTH